MMLMEVFGLGRAPDQYHSCILRHVLVVLESPVS